jgi:hypothetical protein
MSEYQPDDRPPESVESERMAARQRNIRMEDALWGAAAEEAERQGMNTSEFIREATMFRLGVIAAITHGKETHEIEAMLRRISERGPEG